MPGLLYAPGRVRNGMLGSMRTIPVGTCPGGAWAESSKARVDDFLLVVNSRASRVSR